MNRTLILAALAVVALVVGFAVSFFELIVLGVVFGVAAAVVAVRGHSAAPNN